MADSRATQNRTNNELQRVKTQLLSLTSEQFDALQMKHPHPSLQTQVQGIGWLNLFWGAVILLLGVGFTGDSSVIQALLGLVMIFLSLWLILSASPIGAVAWGVLLGISGLWDLFTAVSERNVVRGIIGLAQLWWAFDLYRAFRVNSQITKQDAKAIRLYSEMQHAVKKLKANNDDDSDFLRLDFNHRWWQGFLLPDYIVLAPRQGTLFIVAPRSKTTFTFTDGKGLINKRISGTVHINGITLKRGTFPRVIVEKYNRWKGLSDAQTIAWLDKFDLDNKKRLPTRILILSFLTVPVIFLLWIIYTIAVAATT